MALVIAKAPAFQRGQATVVILAQSFLTIDLISGFLASFLGFLSFLSFFWLLFPLPMIDSFLPKRVERSRSRHSKSVREADSSTPGGGNNTRWPRSLNPISPQNVRAESRTNPTIGYGVRGVRFESRGPSKLNLRLGSRWAAAQQKPLTLTLSPTKLGARGHEKAPAPHRHRDLN